MYDELIEELRRHHCDAKEDDTQEVCEECAYDVIIADKSVPSGIASVCVCGLMNRAADAIEELSRENESLAKSVNEASEILRRRWIPVAERLPEEHDFVLIRQDDDRMMIAERVDGDWWYRYFAYDVDRWDENEQGTITHWMPLPQTPKGETYFKKEDIFGSGEETTSKPITNADRIRSMSDEELAEYMDGSFRNADWCDQSKFPGGDCMEAPCIGCITDWLKEEVNA